MERTLYNCQKWLGFVWVIGIAMVLILLIGRTMTGFYGQEVEKVWDWFSSNLAPTLSLVIATFVYSAFSTKSSTIMVKGATFVLALVSSAFFLLIVIGVLTAGALLEPGGIKTIEASGFYLGILQGAAAALLGVFFMSKEMTTSKGSNQN